MLVCVTKVPSGVDALGRETWLLQSSGDPAVSRRNMSVLAKKPSTLSLFIVHEPVASVENCADTLNVLVLYSSRPFVVH